MNSPPNGTNQFSLRSVFVLTLLVAHYAAMFQLLGAKLAWGMLELGAWFFGLIGIILLLFAAVGLLSIASKTDADHAVSLSRCRMMFYVGFAMSLPAIIFMVKFLQDGIR